MGVRFSLTAPKNNEQSEYIFGVYWESSRQCTKNKEVLSKIRVFKGHFVDNIGDMWIKDVLKDLNSVS